MACLRIMLIIYITDVVESCKTVNCPEFSQCIANQLGHPTCDCSKGFTLEVSDRGSICKGLSVSLTVLLFRRFSFFTFSTFLFSYYIIIILTNTEF